VTQLTSSALRAAAPYAAPAVWLGHLQAAFDRWEINTPRRIAAALGQFAAEAGDDLGELVEITNYTSAARLVAVFPSRFPSVAFAAGYVFQPERIANRCYAGKLGNGNEASGDGWLYRGRGLIQITGRDEYREMAKAIGLGPEDAAAPAGAAMSGCWYLVSRGCLPLADDWRISEITRRVNGSAMLGNALRIRASNAALGALQQECV
jgi:predicted chitinase